MRLELKRKGIQMLRRNVGARHAWRLHYLILFLYKTSDIILVMVTRKRISVILVIIYLALAIILSLPAFAINWDQGKFEFPNIDLSIIAQDSTLGNFFRSSGIFSTKNVSANVDWGVDELTDDEKVILLGELGNSVLRRARFAGAYDVEIQTRIMGSEYKITLVFPDYYRKPLDYAQWLLATGEITFVSADGTTEVDIRDTDVRGIPTVEYIPDSTVTTHIRMTLDSSLQEELTTIFSASEQGNIFMSIDGLPAYGVYRDSIKNDLNTLLAVPASFINLETPAERNFFLNMTRAYFLDPSAYSYQLQVSDVIETGERPYAREGANFLAVMFVLSGVGICLYSFYQLNRRNGVIFTLTLTSIIFTTVVMLKYLAAHLSTGTILGFIGIYIMAVIYSWEIASKPTEAEKSITDKYFVASIFIVVVSLLTSKLFFEKLELYYDLAGALILGSIALSLIAKVNLKGILKIRNDVE